VLHMADADVLPYDYVTYGKEIEQYLDAAQKKASDAHVTLDFAAANAAAKRFTAAAETVRQKQDHPTGNEAGLNTSLRAVESDLLSPEGLPRRPWYKHTIYAPGSYAGYAAEVLPGVNEALDRDDAATFQQEAAALTAALSRASARLDQVAQLATASK